jgi:Zn-finger nucleic acid-binding protein
MKCPVDNTELKEQEYERAVMVDACSTCGGMWMDQWELKAIQANKGKNYEAELSQLPNLVEKSHLQALEKNRPLLHCPKCAENGKSIKMDRREHGYCSQIMVDVCHECQGVWLDQGEVQALEIFFERHHMDDAEIKTGFFHSLWFMLNK